MIEVGTQFGKWKIIEYLGKIGYGRSGRTTEKCLCECECGERKEVVLDNLIRKKSRSCRSCSRKLDLTGMLYGNLTVRKQTNKELWECECSCGKLTEKSTEYLRNNRNPSCGCVRRKHNLIGKRFGSLQVMDYVIGGNGYNCKCNRCGEFSLILSSNLVKGNRVTCGCSKRIIDLSGMTFGYLIVLSYHGTIRTSPKTTVSAWNCICKCGNEKIVPHQVLIDGKRKSCGCGYKENTKERKIDLSGQQFGDLVVTSFDKMVDGNSHWICECKCGQRASVGMLALKSGQKSCGCKQGWWRSEWPGLWKNQAEYAKWQRSDPLKRLKHGVSSSIRSMLLHNGSYKRRKSIRNYLPYTIEELKSHLESLWEPWMSWDNYGGKSNEERRTWHIDHIIPHSSFPYKSMEDPLFAECWTLGNLRPLEKIENIRKGAKLII